MTRPLYTPEDDDYLERMDQLIDQQQEAGEQ